MRTRPSSGKTIAARLEDTRSGVTLLEVCVAMALTTLMCVGLYAVGLQARKFAEHSRVATEARSLAKQRLEEMISAGLANLVKPTCTLTAPITNQSSLGYTLVRRPRIVWHAADGSVVAASNAIYAEVHVDVTYIFLTGRRTWVTDLLAM